jgi:hypothetical protein
LSTPKISPPSVTPETWRALLNAADSFAKNKPWERLCDTDIVGLIDPITGETRIGTVLGNAREVFAAIFYRRPPGLRWILQITDEAFDPANVNFVEGMDVLKVEFVPRRELTREDRAVLKAADYRSAGKGRFLPQFRSAEPGWHPWYIDQKEARQILGDLTRLTAFCTLFTEHPKNFHDRASNDIPFLPVNLPDRPLNLTDLDWRPLLPPPAEPSSPFKPVAEELAQLMALPQNGQATFEFDCSILPGASFLEQGRPCFGRISLLAETQRGLVLGIDLQSGALPRDQAAGISLVKSLLSAGHRPRELHIYPSPLRELLQPLCSTLGIHLLTRPALPALEMAIESLAQSMPL